MPEPSKSPRETTGTAQRQDSLEEQFKDVAQKAREMGCYDAEDWMWRHWHDQSSATRQAVKSTYPRRRP